MERLANPELGHLLWTNMVAVLHYLWPVFVGSVWSLFMFRLGRVVENRMWVKHPEFKSEAAKDMIKDLRFQLRNERAEKETLQKRNVYLSTIVQSILNVTSSVKRI